MAAVTAVVAGVSYAVAGAVKAGKAHKEMRKARSAKNEAKFKLEQAINNRRDITNPYAGVTDLSGLASDLSSQITNPFNNLQVSTAAAEMQAEETDIALANTLDTLEQTGASAGGATALAMAALKSKKDVAATIETQEAANSIKQAEGEQYALDNRIKATERYEDTQIAQGMRVQDAEAAGEIFQYQAHEARSVADINRYQNMYQGFFGHQQTAALASAEATGQMIQGVGQAVGGVFSTDGMGAGTGNPYFSSDRRMKKNIKLIDKSPSGLNIYAFEYINKLFGEGVWQGVMSDEVPTEAVIKNFAGEFDGVDYSKVDVEFKKIQLS